MRKDWAELDNSFDKLERDGIIEWPSETGGETVTASVVAAPAGSGDAMIDQIDGELAEAVALRSSAASLAIWEEMVS
jgi:hypothetical protein